MQPQSEQIERFRTPSRQLVKEPLREAVREQLWAPRQAVREPEEEVSEEEVHVLPKQGRKYLQTPSRSNVSNGSHRSIRSIRSLISKDNCQTIETLCGALKERCAIDGGDGAVVRGILDEAVGILEDNLSTIPHPDARSIWTKERRGIYVSDSLAKDVDNGTLEHIFSDIPFNRENLLELPKLHGNINGSKTMKHMRTFMLWWVCMSPTNVRTYLNGQPTKRTNLTDTMLLYRKTSEIVIGILEDQHKLEEADACDWLAIPADKATAWERISLMMRFLTLSILAVHLLDYLDEEGAEDGEVNQ